MASKSTPDFRLKRRDYYKRKKLEPGFLEKKYIYEKAYIARNKEKVSKYKNEYLKVWRKKNPDKYRAIKRRVNQKRRKFIIDFLGGKCVNHLINYGTECYDIRVLQIDHKEGDGNTERRKYKNKVDYLMMSIKRDILAGVDVKKRYQVLCANCNWIKFYENEEFIKKPSCK
jgi:hypothetical protein